MELNLNRIINLIKRDIGIYWQTYLKAMLAIISVQAIANNTDFELYWFIMAFTFAFKEYNNSTKLRIQITNLPASNLEKYLYSFFIIFLLFPLIILISMYGGLLLRYFLDVIVFGLTFTQTIDLTPRIWSSMTSQILIYAPMVSIFFFGNIYFNKQGGLKMIFYIIAFSLLVFVINAIILYFITGGLSHSFIIQGSSIPKFVKYIVSFGITGFFIILAYLSLTEKEV